MIALILGWMFAGEDLNMRILVASTLTVVAVGLIVGGRYRSGTKQPPPNSPELDV
jgi:hypothetical protein